MKKLNVMMIAMLTMFVFASCQKESISDISLTESEILLFLIYALYFEIIGIYLQSLKEGRNNKLKKWQIINHR